MSVISVISGNTPLVGKQPTAAVDPAKATQNKVAAAKTPPPPPPRRDTAKLDTARLNISAQAKALRQAGKTPAQIAYLLNSDVKTVDGYLGIQNAAPSTTAAAAAAPATPAAAKPAVNKVDIKV